MQSSVFYVIFTTYKKTLIKRTTFSHTKWYPQIHKLSHKIEIATRMNVTARYSSTLYQTTNYGLGGLCETHIDPHGYLDGVVVPNEKVRVTKNGLRELHKHFKNFLLFLSIRYE